MPAGLTQLRFAVRGIESSAAVIVDDASRSVPGGRLGHEMYGSPAHPSEQVRSGHGW